VGNFPPNHRKKLEFEPRSASGTELFGMCYFLKYFIQLVKCKADNCKNRMSAFQISESVYVPYPVSRALYTIAHKAFIS
jgi:hypothetical protein